MANAQQIADLRRMISEPDQTVYTDGALSTLIDAAANDLNIVARDIWEEKANTYSEMVDITEAGSSRKNSQLMANAQSRAAYYAQRATAEAPVPGTDLPSTTPIVRA